MNEVMRAPVDPTNPLRFSVLRVPFFLEPNYERGEDWHETNRVRLERKWGGKAAFAAQKHRHRLKERGQEVGIEHFNLDRQGSLRPYTTSYTIFTFFFVFLFVFAQLTGGLQLRWGSVQRRGWGGHTVVLSRDETTDGGEEGGLIY